MKVSFIRKAWAMAQAVANIDSARVQFDGLKYTLTVRLGCDYRYYLHGVAELNANRVLMYRNGDAYVAGVITLAQVESFQRELIQQENIIFAKYSCPSKDRYTMEPFHITQ